VIYPKYVPSFPSLLMSNRYSLSYIPSHIAPKEN
jgi:hypothetical protein